MAQIDKLSKIQGSRQEGGWSASGEIYSDADRLDYYQTLNVWFDMYAGGVWEALPRPAFEGLVMPDPFDRLVQGSKTKWSAFTAQELMKNSNVQGVFFNNVASTPDNHHQIVGMNYAKIVKHILGQTGEYGHCNLVFDVWPEGFLTTNIDTTNSTSVATYEVKAGNFWQRLTEIAGLDDYMIYIDKAGVINYIPHPMFGTLPTPVLTLTSDLLLESLTVEKRNPETVGQLKLTGHTPSGLQISGAYPTSPGAGPIVVRSGYLAVNNAALEAIAERKYRWDNRDYTVTAVLPGAIGLMLEICDRVAITCTSAVDGIAWSEKKFWVEKITVSPDENFNAVTELVLEAEN